LKWGSDFRTVILSWKVGVRQVDLPGVSGRPCWLARCPPLSPTRNIGEPRKPTASLRWVIGAQQPPIPPGSHTWARCSDLPLGRQYVGQKSQKMTPARVIESRNYPVGDSSSADRACRAATPLPERRL